MVDLNCPSCGRVGSAPNEKAHSRLVCKKCHAVFHVAADGKTRLGEPVSAQTKIAHPTTAPKPDRDGAGFSLLSAGDLSRPMLAVLGLILVAGIGVLSFTVFARPAESLETRARIVGQALIDSDLATLKRFSTTASAEDIVRWQESIRPMIEEMKGTSLTNRVNATVIVMSENASVGAGQVTLFLTPHGVQARKKAIEGEADATIRARELGLTWVKSPGGAWLLDGQSTLQQKVVSR